ncbi:glutamate--cysteine ligase [Micrococcoides hystricis]|uniref:Putative glutamate--cysteine ligase 2 n=1 Tax=Micrococcoides hystricis TaxID=1572761 RepID=A0ABV6P9X5_9MICC
MQTEFKTSERSTIGVEWEFGLIEAETGKLSSSAPQVLAELSESGHGKEDVETKAHITNEFLQNTIECVTGVHHEVAQLSDELRDLVHRARKVTDDLGIELFCQGTHPFEDASSQPVTEGERYATLVERTQYWGRQMLIYGVHVHVGLDHVNKAMPVLDGLLNHMPDFLALSASSPFWSGLATGYASQRALVFQQLPTAGLPFQFPDWSGFENCVADMHKTGVIESVTEVRWDIRPVPRYGTIEMRVCDGMDSLAEVEAMTALTQCLVDDFSARLDTGEQIPTMQPWHIQENKWRAARYGLDAEIIYDAAGTERLVTDHLEETLNRLEPVAARLNCAAELAKVEDILRHGPGYKRQEKWAAESGGDLATVVLNSARRTRESTR